MSDLLASVPDEWGPKFDGPSGAVTRTHTGPNEIEYIAPSHMALILFSAQPGREIGLNSDRKTVGIAPVGSVEVVPAGAELFARWTVEKENLLVAMDDDRLRRLASLEFDTDTFELQPPKLGYVDDRGLFLGKLMREEILRRDMSNEEYLDSLLTIFGTYLLRRYSSIRRVNPQVPKGGMTFKNWKKIDEYIQEHLSGKLSLSELSKLAGLSPTHFLRAFRHTTGQTPHQYILQARLSRARQLIATTDMPLSLVAKAVGFHSHSHMTATMQRVWLTTPTELRRN